MKKLTLLFNLLLSIGIFSQNSNLQLELIKPLKKACKKGNHFKLEKFFVKKHGCKKYVLDGYEIFKSDYLEDYNYVFSNISSDKDYYKTVYYAVTKLLNPKQEITYETHPKFTAIHQIDKEDNYHVVFILADLPRN
ncbi:MAG: hypothetical protein Unbinned2299contig1000_83 [Prokaryotic dsDNA virus sp.]|nr:MAG: hypothetical protein Unbinned2299contig1000_83 [Prokaryotic dsDNA virus sp.]|tara:strand:+ start:1818 stop:2225 length:408 start_codon:yes stop_codon:yes gene_type:complete